MRKMGNKKETKEEDDEEQEKDVSEGMIRSKRVRYVRQHVKGERRTRIKLRHEIKKNENVEGYEEIMQMKDGN